MTTNMRSLPHESHCPFGAMGAAHERQHGCACITREIVDELTEGQEWALRWNTPEGPIVRPVETEKRARALAPHVNHDGDERQLGQVVSRRVGPWEAAGTDTP